MARSWVGALGAFLVLVALPGLASAQARSCEQVLPSDARRLINAAGQEMVYFRDPVRVFCTGGVRIEADSAVMNRSASTLELVGRVVYLDGEQRLTSDWANYLGRSEELFARGQVVLTDLADGSVISGDDLEYRRQTAERPESRMIVRGRRPHAVLRRATAAQAADTAAPVRIWAGRMEFVGESLFTAEADVEIERGDMRGAADHARFDQAAERMTLTGTAHVESDLYRLDAARIDAFLAGETLREVHAARSARLRSDELTVHAERIQMRFDDGALERMEAWNPDPGPEVGRALAIAEDFHLRADSIDARADAGSLREVRAVGRAYGERELDDVGRRMPEAISRDWIQGDTIIGFFAQDQAASQRGDRAEGEDDAGDATVLERIEVAGGSSEALSLYRMEPSNGRAAPSINFMRASRIILFMSQGEVTRVEADGPIEGLYLDPTRPTGGPTADDAARGARS